MSEEFISIAGKQIQIHPLSNQGLRAARNTATTADAALYTLFTCNRQRHLERGKHLSGHGLVMLTENAATIALEPARLNDTDLPGYQPSNGALLILLEHWHSEDAFIAGVVSYQLKRTLTYGDPRMSDVTEVLAEQRRAVLLPATITGLTGGVLLELDTNGQLEISTHT